MNTISSYRHNCSGCPSCASMAPALRQRNNSIPLGQSGDSVSFKGLGAQPFFKKYLPIYLSGMLSMFGINQLQKPAVPIITTKEPLALEAEEQVHTAIIQDIRKATFHSGNDAALRIAQLEKKGLLSPHVARGFLNEVHNVGNVMPHDPMARILAFVEAKAEKVAPVVTGTFAKVANQTAKVVVGAAKKAAHK